MRFLEAIFGGARVHRTALVIGLLALGTMTLGVALPYMWGSGGRVGDNAFAAGGGQAPTSDDAFTPELGLPATGVVAIGSSTQGGQREVWAYGALGAEPVTIDGREYSNQYALLQRTTTASGAAAGGWQVLPLPAGPEGKPLAPMFGQTTPADYGAFAGETTDDGGVVLLSGQSVVVRDPHGTLRLAPAPHALGSTTGAAENEVLAPGESLLPSGESSGAVTLPYAAIEDGGGHTGVLVAPHHHGGAGAGEPETLPGVLHYDGKGWTREPIELTQAQKNGFTALALACGGTGAAPAASSPQNCWLLATYSAGGVAQDRLALFRRVASREQPSGYVWESERVAGGMIGEQASTPVKPLAQGAQMLTATAQGVWVDFQAAIAQAALGGGREFSDVSVLATAAGAGEASTVGPWCYPTGPGCEHASLGGPLPARYRSFAWPGAGSGTRVITGLSDRAMLELPEGGTSFTYVVGAGGAPGSAPGAAAFYPPGAGGPLQGWVADGANPSAAADGEGQSQAITVAPTPSAPGAEPLGSLSVNGPGDELGAEAVPFRRPLLAVAQAPGTAPGAPDAPALAVGLEGQVARYTPGEGWRPEALYNSAGQTDRPTLRGVAWPEPNRAYAVGDNGAMWMWSGETGLWEPDPAAPFNFIGNLTAIAFDPGEPRTGFAVGKQGVLLRYAKSWEQIPSSEAARLGGELGAEESTLNFTSIAFAGGEALATYRVLRPVAKTNNEFMETGGVLAFGQDPACAAEGESSCWHADTAAAALLGRLPNADDTVLSKVAGLPDGGAVAAGPSAVIERESPSSPWHFASSPLPEAQNISALGAYREPGTGAVRAVVSIDLDDRLGPSSFAGVNLEDGAFKVDLPAPSAPNEPPPFLEADPLPSSGYVLKETAGGWQDMEHMALPAPQSKLPEDMPVRPDPVLALLIGATGADGLAVGGQTGNLEGRGVEPELFPDNTQSQTAAAMRFPAGAASSDGNATAAAVPAPAGKASFVVAGNAACVEAACADFAEEHIGPDTWLEHALQEASAIARAAPAGAVRDFLYTGTRLSAREQCRGGGAEQQACEEGATRESERLNALLAGTGSLPVCAADSEDLGPAGASGCPASEASCSFTSEGRSGGDVAVIVLNFADGSLGDQSCVEKSLREAQEAHQPAIVLGNDALGFTLPQSPAAPVEAGDASAVARILVEGQASAYFFDYPGANVKTSVSYGTKSIPAYGSGTLGYVPPPNERFEADSLGSSGFLLASVSTTEHSSSCRPQEGAACNLWKVNAEAVPNIGSLALDATDGVFLRRSQVALFDALARRPPAGIAIKNGASGAEVTGPDPYDPIPFDCQGANCADAVPTQYTFTSSNPDIASFV
ncbi:MAG: hypothetical protein FWD42_03595, partial [Solirubrobacterales bacterium]|nr:hypothetical protein [Solirubrobacterales bacterium]